MENNELELKSEQLNAESNVLSPEKEAAYRTEFHLLRKKSATSDNSLHF